MESRKITPGSLVGNETNIWSFTRGCTCLQNGCKLTPVLLYKARKTRQMQITFISMCALLWPSTRNSAKQITAMLCADERAYYVYHHRWTAYSALVARSCFFFFFLFSWRSYFFQKENQVMWGFKLWDTTLERIRWLGISLCFHVKNTTPKKLWESVFEIIWFLAGFLIKRICLHLSLSLINTKELGW